MHFSRVRRARRPMVHQVHQHRPQRSHTLHALAVAKRGTRNRSVPRTKAMIKLVAGKTSQAEGVAEAEAEEEVHEAHHPAEEDEELSGVTCQMTMHSTPVQRTTGMSVMQVVNQPMRNQEIGNMMTRRHTTLVRAKTTVDGGAYIEVAGEADPLVDQPQVGAAFAVQHAAHHLVTVIFLLRLVVAQPHHGEIAQAQLDLGQAVADHVVVAERRSGVVAGLGDFQCVVEQGQEHHDQQVSHRSEGRTL